LRNLARSEIPARRDRYFPGLRRGSAVLKNRTGEANILVLWFILPLLHPGCPASRWAKLQAVSMLA